MTASPTCDHGIDLKDYCFACVCDRAKQACIDRGEGWRWGVNEPRKRERRRPGGQATLG